MRYLLYSFLFIGLSLHLHAQEMLYPIGKDAAYKEIHLATEGDSIRAFVLVGAESLHFWNKKNGIFVKVGEHPKPFGVAFIGSIYTPEKVHFFFELHNGKKIFQFDISSKEKAVIATTFGAPEGRLVQNFVHEGKLFNLTFLKKENALRVRHIEPDGTQVEKDYVLPKSKATALQYANTSYEDLKHLRYRSPSISDPSILSNKKHIFLATDAMYLVYPKNTGNADVFIVSKLHISDQRVDRRIIKAENTPFNDDANLYFANNAFLLYAINKTQITLSSIDPVSWNVQDFYVLTEKDEKIHEIPIQQDGAETWTLFGNMNRKNLINKLYEYGAAYVYVNPAKDTTSLREIVIGKVVVKSQTSGGIPVAGEVYTPIFSQTYTIHPYVMLQYNKISDSMLHPQTAWKSPASVKDNIGRSLRASELLPGANKHIFVHHLGDRALIAYVDKKRDAVVVRYEPLY